MPRPGPSPHNAPRPSPDISPRRTSAVGAETQAYESGRDFMLGVSLGNRAVVAHLLAHGFRMDAEFLMLFMSDKPSSGFDRYVFSMPGFFT